MDRLTLAPQAYLLATVHRASNTDSPARLAGIVEGLSGIDESIVFPVHPRTRQALKLYDLTFGSNVRLIDPVGYRDMIALEQSARMVLTDSGGVLREAFFFGIPCLTLRDEIELIELVWSGWNVLVGADPGRIYAAWKSFQIPKRKPALLGDGRAAERIVRILAETPPEYGRAYDVDMAQRPDPETGWDGAFS